VVLHDPCHEGQSDRVLERRLSHALSESLARHSERSHSGRPQICWAGARGGAWVKDCTLLRLKGSADESVGVLCLANRGKHTTSQDEQLLHAIASHASVALEMRAFSRAWTKRIGIGWRF